MTTPRIVAFRKDVFIIGETEVGRGARRWIKKTAKFSGSVYFRPGLYIAGVEVPEWHPAHAVLAEILAERARYDATEKALFGPRASLER
jgi:hypothetical protein